MLGYHGAARRPLQAARAAAMRSQRRRGAYAVPRPTSTCQDPRPGRHAVRVGGPASRGARLTAALRDHLPRPVAAQVRVSSTASAILTLAASSGAIAAALRQRSPELLAALRREGWDFTEIKVRVQVRGLAGAPVKSAGNQRDATGAGALFDLSDELREGPLRASIQRWSRRARGR